MIPVTVKRDEFGTLIVEIEVEGNIVKLSSGEAMRLGCNLVSAGTAIVCDDYKVSVDEIKRRESMQ